MPAAKQITIKPERVALKIAGIAFLLVTAFLALAAIRLNVAPWDIFWFSNSTHSNSLLSIAAVLRIELVVLTLVATIAGLLVMRKHYQSEFENTHRSMYSSTTEAGASIASVHASEDGKLSEENEQLPNPLDSEQEKELTALRGEVPFLDARSRGNLESQVRITNDELDKVRRELLNCREELEQANLAKSEFLANMSHELLTPLNGIVGMTDLLLGSDLPPREHRFSKSIAGSASSLFSIINDLLDYTKLESGILKIEKAEFSVRECVEDVCSSMAKSAHEKNIELMCYVDDNVPERMEGDPHRINQIINNLVANAIAFTETGEVVVRLSRSLDAEKSRVFHCEVEDTGAGISPEMQAQLFSAFTQQDSSITRSHGGIGLGLSITKELVSMMGGELTFESRLKEGTRFSFTMELNELNYDDELANRRRTMVGAHVLVVDDNNTNRTILFHQLTNWGLLVETAENGLIALEMLRESYSSGQAFDAVLLDLHMPVMDGLELAQNMQADPNLKTLKPLLLTSTTLPLEAEKLRELGIYRYVNKPVRQSVLHECLLSVMPNQSGTSTANLVNYLIPKSAKVLLVEDNLINRNVAIEMLEQLGCHVSLAENGDEAVSSGLAEKFDIILMDCQMPLMDGYEATRRIKEEGSLNAGTPIVALTANASTGDREKCLDCGMDDYFSKPILTQTLVQILDKWVSYPINKLDPVVLDQSPPILFTGVRDTDLRTTGMPGEIQVDPLQVDIDDSSLSSNDQVTSAVSDDANESPPTQLNEISSASDERVLNPKAIEGIRAMQRPGKEDLLLKIVNAYSTKTPDVLDQIAVAANENNVDSVLSIAKGLGVSSHFLGAEKMSSVCKRIESVVAGGGTGDLSQLVSTLKEEYESVSIELDVIVKAA